MRPRNQPCRHRQLGRDAPDRTSSVALADLRYDSGLMRRQPSPYTEQLATAVGELLSATVSGHQQRARDILRRISHPVAEIEARANVPLATAVRVYRRDSWTCRYCGARTIPIPVLRVLSSLYPEDFPHHPNWKAGLYHPAYLLLSTSLDHIVPGSRGGSWSDSHNLVTSCWPCNTGKADLTLEELGWEDLDADDAGQSDWDGLTSVYPELWKLAGSPDESYHRAWLRLLDQRVVSAGLGVDPHFVTLPGPEL